jgi:hypothetical protein
MQTGDGDVRQRGGTGLEPWQLLVTVADDALEPVLEVGQTVIVDCSDHALVGGGLYAVRDGDRLELWLFVPGFAGLGCQLEGRAIGTLVGLGGTFRCRGPLDLAAIRLVGRVVEPAADALTELARQQRRLTGLRETTRALLLRSGAIVMPRPRPAGGSVEAMAQALAAELGDRAFADRFALEQRLDAIDARLAYLDELVASLPATGLAEALVKLETLAALQPAGAQDLEPRLLASALDALHRLAGDARRPGRSGGLPETAEPVAQPLELVASPRRRR